MIATTFSGSDLISTGCDLTDSVSTRGLLIDLAITAILSSNYLCINGIKSDTEKVAFVVGVTEEVVLMEVNNVLRNQYNFKIILTYD